MTFESLEIQAFFINLMSSKELHFLEAMKIMGERRHIPNISWSTARFIIETLQSRNIHSILEIGPANGFSTLMLSLGCPGASIHSVECSRHAFEELRYNIQKFSTITNDEDFSPAEFGPKVTSEIDQIHINQFSLYYADARELLPAFLHGASELSCTHPVSTIREIPEKRFDCIFIDGAFRMTREFFDLSLPLLTHGGIIILDDAIKYREKMSGFHEYLESRDIPYSVIQTDPDDGVMVIGFGNESK